jgi:hypothetical protein
MLTLSGKALGRKKPLFADWSIPLPPELAGEGVTLREVISRIVREEVASFEQRQAERGLVRVLTARQIETGVQKGKIDMGGRDEPPQPVDPGAAVRTALQAFEDGLFLVVIDGTEHRSLDQQVFLQPDSRITFVRLVLLAGG